MPVEFTRQTTSQSKVQGLRSWELVVDAQIRFENTDSFVTLKTLIDSGSRLPVLFRPGLCSAKRVAPYPVRLRIANGSGLQDGSEGCQVVLRVPLFNGTDFEYREYQPVWGFEAEIVGDGILGYPLLAAFGLAVDCANNQLRKTHVTIASIHTAPDSNMTPLTGDWPSLSRFPTSVIHPVHRERLSLLLGQER